MPDAGNVRSDSEGQYGRIIRFPGKMKPISKYYIVNKMYSKLEISDFKVHHFLKAAKTVQIPDNYYDIVISVSDPVDSHLFVKRLKRRGLKYGRWIQHWGDPLYGNISHKLLWPKFVMRFYEWCIMRNADKVVYVTPFSASAQKELHKRLSNKIQFVPLPCDGKTSTNTIERHDGLKVAYVGDYSKYIRNILPLYEACSQMEEITLTIAGYGRPLSTQDNITILSRVPYEQAAQIEEEADVIVGICNLKGTQIPGKFFYKSSTNKHILVALEEDHKEEMKAYFESYQRFVICDNRVDSIKEALLNLRDKIPHYSTPQRLLQEKVAEEILS